MPQIRRVEPISGYHVALTFTDGSRAEFDVTPYLDRSEFFAELRDEEVFAQVRAEYGGIAWPGGQSLSADTLELRSLPVNGGDKAATARA